MVDYPYIILILLLVGLTVLNEKYWKDTRLYLAAAILTFVFMAFRAPVVGADTYNYVRFFTGESLTYTTDKRDFEPLFTVYNAVMKVLLFKNGFLYMVVNSTLALLPLFYLVRKYSYNKCMSFLIFFLIGLGTLYFVVLRQLLSLSLLLCGTIYFLNGKPCRHLVFLMFGTAAYFMHTSAIVAIPIYIICYYVKMDRRWIPLALIAFSVVSGLFLKDLDVMKVLQAFSDINLSATDRLSVYYDDDLIDSSSFSILGLTKKSMIGAIAFLFMPKWKINHFFSKVYLVSILLSNFFFEIQLIDRLNLPFEIYSIVVVTWAFGPRLYKLKPKLRLIAFSFIIAVGMYCTYGYISSSINYSLTDSMRMHPYYFFFQEYSNHPSILYDFN